MDINVPDNDGCREVLDKLVGNLVLELRQLERKDVVVGDIDNHAENGVDKLDRQAGDVHPWKRTAKLIFSDNVFKKIQNDFWI